MPPDPWSRDEATAFDLHLQRDLHLPAPLLMENAGAALAREAEQLLSQKGLRRIVLFCGPGNNGGDALVAARQLAGSGLEIGLRLPLPLPAGAQQALDLLVARMPDFRLEPSEAELGQALLVDGLFGLGLSRPLEGAALAAVHAMNRSGCPVLAVDLPSGLHADDGCELGLAVRATRTLTFVAPKRGMLQGLGPAVCGELRIAQIGVSQAYAEDWLRRRRAGLRD